MMISLLRLHVAHSDVIVKGALDRKKGSMFAALVTLYLVPCPYQVSLLH